MKEEKKLSIKITDELLKGVYSNLLSINHTKEEFLLDFMSVIGENGAVVSRVFMSPGHLKRTIKALQENLNRYESKFGAIIEADELGGLGNK